MDFFTWIRELADKKDTLLCVGLDPAVENDSSQNITEALVDFCLRIVETTHPYALCFKPNIAFFERWGSAGYKALESVMRQIPGDVPVIIDAKRNDIGNTAKAYADSIFGHFGAHAVTLNPYMGKDSVEPFLAWENKGLFCLARTSNPSSDQIQLLPVTESDGRGAVPLYVRMAQAAVSWGKNIGLVVGGNDHMALRTLRQELPDTWLLAPGIGAQGGTVEDAIRYGTDKDGTGIIPVVVRHIIQDPDPAGKAREFRDAIRAAREKQAGTKSGKPERRPSAKTVLINALLDHGCFKVGTFTLKSGAISPFYLDLRKLISSPRLLALVARAYIDIISTLAYDRLSAIPVASVPVVTAISLLTGHAMIYPRIPVKTHGSGAPIDGDYRKGERVVLIDDLITTGLSKREALDVLRTEGLVVEDLVVLVERGQDAARELATLGVRLHAVVTITDILGVLEENGKTEKTKIAEIRRFLETS